MIGFMLLGFLVSNLISQPEHSKPFEPQTPVCSSNESPYTDFDFVLGTWDFFSPDGDKIGEQTYTKREAGCLILEEWKLLSGSTGLGMSFVDPATGRWRQVWMSPMFHIDYSGGLDGDGNMVLKGTIYPNNGDRSSPVQGVWKKMSDGSVEQEFLVLNNKSNTWEVLFSGVAKQRSD